VDGENSELISPQTPAIADGDDTQTIRAIIRDASGANDEGNLIGGAQVVFRVPTGTTATGCSGGTGTVVGSATATCNITSGTSGANLGVADLVLTSTIAATYDVTAKADGVDIETGSPAKARFEAGPLSLEHSTLVVTTKDDPKIAGVENHLAQVTIRDKFNNVITATNRQVDVTLNWALETNPAYQDSMVVRTNNGVASFQFTDTVAGWYTISAYVPSGEVANSPQRAQFVAGAAAEAVLTASTGLVSSNGIAAHNGEVLVTDQFGNPVPNAYVRFNVTGHAVLQQPQGSTCGDAGGCTLMTSATGLVKVWVVDTWEETVQLSATLTSAPTVTVTNSPASLRFGPFGPSPDNSSLLVVPSDPIDNAHPCVVADGDDSYHVAVIVKDINNVSVGGAEVDLTIDSPALFDPAGPFVTESDQNKAGYGELVTLAKSTKIGTFTIAAQVGGGHTNGSPTTVNFCSGPMDGGRSWLEGPLFTAVANGVETQVVKAYVVDKFDNPVPNPAVAFNVPQHTQATGCAEGIVSGPGVCTMTGGTDGVASLTLTSTKAGQYSVTAAVGGEAIEGQSPATVEFVSGPVAKSTIEKLEAGPMVANNSDFYTVVVKLYDAFDNPVTQVAGNWVNFTFAQGTQTSTQNAQLNGQGVAQVQFRTTKAGTWLASATYASTPVESGKQVPLAFTHGPLSLPDSDFLVSSSQALADGQASQWVKVILRDAFKNPIPGLTVDIQIEQGALNVVGPWFNDDETASSITLVTCDTAATGAPAWCTEDGLAYAEMRSHEPGTFKVTAQTGGDDIKEPGDYREVGFSAGTPDPDRSYWVVEPDPFAATTRVVADGADSYAITVTIISTSEILVDNAPVRLDLTGLPNLAIVEPPDWFTGTPLNPPWGEFTFHVTSTLNGWFYIPVQVYVNGDWLNIEMPGQPLAPVKFGTGKPTADNTWLVDVPDSVEVDQSQTVTVKAVDDNGLPVDNGTVIIHVPTDTCPATGDPVFAVNGDVEVDFVDGVATLELTTTCAGEYEITASIKSDDPNEPDVPITMVKDDSATSPDDPDVRTDGTVTIRFRPGEPSHDTSTITISRPYIEANHHNPEARGYIDTGWLTITLRDRFNNVVTDYTGDVTVYASDPSVQLANGGKATRQANGTYRIEVASPVDGDHTFGFTLDGDTESTDTATSKFVPTPAAPSFNRTRSPAGGISGQSEPGMWIEVVRQDTGAKVCDTQADATGNWSCTYPSPQPHGAVLVARAVERQYQVHGPSPEHPDYTFASVQVNITVNANGPADPIMDPSDGYEITGTVPDYDPDLDGDYVVDIINDDTGEVLCAKVKVNRDGTFSCTPSKPLKSGTRVKAVVEDEAGNTSEGYVVVRHDPPKLEIDPSDGTKITGDGDPGNDIVITDKDGKEVCKTTVDAKGKWVCVPDKPLNEGDIVTVTTTDPAGNKTSKPWRIGLPRVEVSKPIIEQGDTQTITGKNFQPGEEVEAFFDGKSLGKKKANADGTVTWTHKIPEGTTVGKHTYTLVGELSGTHSVDFEVVPPADRVETPLRPQAVKPAMPKGKLPFTGSNDLVGLMGSALGALLGGGLLLLAWRRRREEEEESTSTT